MRIASFAALAIAATIACSKESDPLAPSQPVDPARVRIVVPEVYELTNVIIAMTSYGLDNSSLVYKSSSYYSDVSKAFLQYKSSAPMKELQLGDDDPLRRYYEMRDNSYTYVFDQGQIKHDPTYGTLRNPNTFSDKRTDIERFNDVSQFRAFYEQHSEYYRTFIERYRSLAEIDSMADWLEREFAPTRYDHYTVVLSPLVYGSHSAYNSTTSAGLEALMFVAGPDVTTPPTTSAGVQKATIQRIVFTEIDHNFVNPVTTQYLSRVNSVFGNRAKWTTDASSFYGSAEAVFNEYMTWGVFLLYVESRVSSEDFQTVMQLTTQLMEGSRRFQRFGSFTQELLRLYHARTPGGRARELYPAILDWAQTQ
jgi:hypothetical protein